MLGSQADFLEELVTKNESEAKGWAEPGVRSSLLELGLWGSSGVSSHALLRIPAYSSLLCLNALVSQREVHHGSLWTLHCDWLSLHGGERLNSTRPIATRPGCGLSIPAEDAFLGCSIDFVSDPLLPGNNRIFVFL